MIATRLKQDLHEFLDDAPGKRFERRYTRKRRDRVSTAGRFAWLAGGVALVLVGFVFFVIPGPGILFVAAGVACIAQESRRLAQFCDRLEVQVRKLLTRVRKRFAR